MSATQGHCTYSCSFSAGGGGASEQATCCVTIPPAGEGPCFSFILLRLRFLFRSKVLEDLDSFEKGMGTILRNAWTHIEALQTTDIPLLVEYVTRVRGMERGRGVVRKREGGEGEGGRNM